MSVQSSKAVKFGSITTSETFTEFESLAVIGNGVTITLENASGESTVWPANTVFAIGGAGPKLIASVKVTSTDASYALFS